MRKVIILAVLLFTTPSFAMDDSNVPHFWTGAALGIAADTVAYHYAKRMDTMERILVSSGIAFVPGIINEIVDNYRHDNHFGWDDLGYDALGALTGALTSELINGQFWISASGRQISLVGKW